MLGVFNLGPFLEWSLKPHYETFFYNFFFNDSFGVLKIYFRQNFRSNVIFGFFEGDLPAEVQIFSIFSIYFLYISIGKF